MTITLLSPGVGGEGDVFGLTLLDGGVLPVEVVDGAGAFSGALAFVTTPNLETTVNITPGVAGKILAVADITPKATGDLLISVNLAANTSSADQPAMVVFLVTPLTAIAGGAPLASPHPGITTNATDTTPTATSGTDVMAVENATFVDGAAANVAILTVAGAPVKVPVGQRTGVVVFVRSTNEAFTWVCGLSMSVKEVF